MVTSSMKGLKYNNCAYEEGAPHVLTQDDVYDGYFLPKGTMVLPNQW